MLLRLSLLTQPKENQQHLCRLLWLWKLNKTFITHLFDEIPVSTCFSKQGILYFLVGQVRLLQYIGVATIIKGEMREFHGMYVSFISYMYDDLIKLELRLYFQKTVVELKNCCLSFSIFVFLKGLYSLGSRLVKIKHEASEIVHCRYYGTQNP